ncbi:MAG: hypothetical protein E6J20_04060 [Chloroflexi bacterium]|nr:MAG: hypothetical protein E6J20_04060 [Chloroflexota bacterium]
MKARRLSATAVIDLARRASFVFRGSVRAVGKHNLEGVEPDDRMATVRVTEVVVAPPSLGDLKGKTITVFLSSSRGVKVADQMTFFATSWIYGSNIGVTEIGRTGMRAAELRQLVIDARLEAQHEELETRLRRAVLVVSGQVITTFRTERKDLPGTDEGVEWWEAELWVASVEKGSPPRDLHIFYPVGGDREWGPVPKSHPGQLGVWLLGPLSEPDAEEQEPDRRRRPAKTTRDQMLMALDPLDYQAISALSHVRELLRRTTKG